ncbi:MAG: hypothetical protein ABIR70_08200 [Bryobacteraceae bacterium]
MKTAVVILLLVAAPSFAHRLDEYLQGTLITVGKTQLQAEMTLTPGVAILPFLLRTLDPDADGVISESEQRAYAAQVLADLSLKIDNQHLTPQLTLIRFPTLEYMKEGHGEIHLDFSADLPAGGRDRKVTLQNHHLNQISVYQVNSLVPQDAAIEIAAQVRNESQSSYEVDYVQGGAVALSSTRWILGFLALLVAIRGLFLLQRTVSPSVAYRAP